MEMFPEWQYMARRYSVFLHLFARITIMLLQCDCTYRLLQKNTLSQKVAGVAGYPCNHSHDWTGRYISQRDGQVNQPLLSGSMGLIFRFVLWIWHSPVTALLCPNHAGSLAWRVKSIMAPHPFLYPGPIWFFIALGNATNINTQITQRSCWWSHNIIRLRSSGCLTLGVLVLKMTATFIITTDNNYDYSNRIIELSLPHIMML